MPAFPRFPRASAIAAATAVALLLGACTKQTPEQLVDAAQRHLAANDAASAQIELRNAIQAAPDHALAHRLLGSALLRLGDPVSAESILRRALGLGQPPDQVLPLLAQALLRQGQSQKLIDEFGSTTLMTPAAQAALLASLGHARLALDQFGPAATAFAGALAAQPGQAYALVGQAAIAAHEQRDAEAQALVDTALRSDPGLVEAHALRARLTLAAGRRAEAVAQLERAIAADATYLPARLMLASVLIDAKDHPAAARLLDAAGRAAGDPRVQYLRALSALHQGELAAAREAARAALRVAPDYQPALALAGEIELHSGNFSTAEQYFGQAMAREATPAVRQLLATAQLRQGRAAKALRTLEPLVQDGAARPDGALLLLAGEAQLANGDLQRAAAYFEAAKSAQAAEAPARTRLGELALRAGDLQRGEQELLAAAGRAGPSVEPDLLLVSMYLRQRENDKALAAARDFARKQPQNPLGPVLAGAALRAQKKDAEARQSFEAALRLQADHLPALRALAELDRAQGREGDALKRYETLLKERPGDEPLLLALAELQELIGQGDPAVTLRRAVDASPRTREPVIALVHYHLRRGRADAALDVARAAAQALPDDAEVALLLGQVQEAAGAGKDALRTLTAASVMDPQALGPLLRLAQAQARQRDFAAATATLQRAQEKAPNNLLVAREIANVHLHAGRLDRALQVARALQARPGQAAVGHALEGDLLALSSRWPEAERAYRAALAADPAAGDAAAQVYRMLFAQRRQKDADAWADDWIARHPSDPTMRLLAADAARRTQRLPAAIAHFEAVLALDPQQPLVLASLAATLADARDARALGVAERAAGLAPRDPDVLETWGRLQVQAGDPARGLETLRRARELAPQRVDLRLSYAKGLLSAGRQVEGKAELRELAAVSGDFPGRAEVQSLLQGL